MQKITKKAWIEIACCSLAFAALAVIAAFFDLAINKALYQPSSLFGQFYAKLGEIPAYIAAPVVGAILFYQDFGKTKKQRISYKIITALLVCGGFFFALNWFWGNFMSDGIEYSIVYKLFFSAVLTAALLLSLIKVDKALMKKLFILAVFITIAVSLGNVIVQIMKLLWGRQRFRTMANTEKNASLIAVYGNDFKGFSPWYKPYFIFGQEARTAEYYNAHIAVDSDTFKSFPSGHTVGAAASFAVILLPDMFKKLEKYKWLFWVAPAIHTVLTGVSRIIVGAHYLSDVLFGGFIGFASAALFRYIIVSKGFLKQLKVES